MKRHHPWRGHPPQAWSPDQQRQWQRKGGWLFLQLSFVFGLIVMLFLGGMAILALLLTRVAGGREEVALLVWVLGCGLALALPIFAIALAARTFRRVTTPLADIMAAADAVAEGDFSVRVAEIGRRGQFDQLARSFNRMAAELDRTDQLRRNLTADVAHELRTPLHIIQGNLEGIVDHVYEPTDEHISATLEETRMLARLVDDLHLLSQAETGQLTLSLEPVDVGELLADVETSFSGQAGSKGIELKVKVNKGGRELRVTGDVDRLDQVLSNLVVNALRYTPPGGQIQLRAFQFDDTVQIEVEDNGVGIPAGELPYIFDRFWRGDVSRSHSDGSGAGLGLAISRQLVQAHQGTIEAQSEDRGTRFIIRLPAEEFL